MNKNDRQKLIDYYNDVLDVNSALSSLKFKLEDINSSLYFLSNKIKKQIYMIDKGLADDTEITNNFNPKEYKSTRPDTYK